MNLYNIAFNNFKRRKVKVLMILCGLVIGTATAIALFMIVESMRWSLGDQIDEFGANIVIVPRSEGMEINYGGAEISEVSLDYQRLVEDDLNRISEIPDYDSINIVSPKMITAVNIGETEALFVGIKPEKEFIMKPWFTLQDQAGLTSNQKPVDLALIELPDNGLILGYEASRALDLHSGDEIEINGVSFYVTGIINPLGSVEDGLIYGNLATLQNILNRPGEISMIEISAYCNSCPIEEIAAQLSDILPNGRVTALRQAALLREETIDRFSTFSFILSGIILFIAALMVLTTMMSSVHERTREIGIFRAIGFRGSHIIRIFFFEAGLIGLAGGLLGYLVGSTIAKVIGPYLTLGITLNTWQPDLLLPAVLISVAVAISASAYPALKAARLDPVESLRFI
jgi:putative ABC transport system permease protein